jgi:hypothetical protein
MNVENEMNTPGSPDEKNLASSPEIPDTIDSIEAKNGQVSSTDEDGPGSYGDGPHNPEGPRITVEHVTVICIVLTLLVSSLITAWYQKNTASSSPGMIVSREGAEYVNIRVFYPSPQGLVPEEREVEKSDLKMFMVEAAVNEYFKGPTGDASSSVPEGTKLLAILQGSDGTVYLNISHEFRSRFKGDAYGEFLLLRGLYESVMSNAGDVNGLKLLIEGKEVETIGGHISLRGTLGSVITSTMVKDSGNK